MISNKVAFESNMWCLHLPSKTTSFKIYARSHQRSIFSLTSHNKIVQFLINLSEWSDLFVNQSLWSRDVEMCQYITAIVVKNFILCYSLQIYNLFRFSIVAPFLRYLTDFLETLRDWGRIVIFESYERLRSTTNDTFRKFEERLRSRNNYIFRRSITLVSRISHNICPLV